MDNNDTSMNGAKFQLVQVWRDGKWVWILVIK